MTQEYHLKDKIVEKYYKEIENDCTRKKINEKRN